MKTMRLLAAALVVSLGCGKAGQDTPGIATPPAEDTFTPPSAPALGVQIHVPQFRVKPNSEILMCTFTDKILEADAQVEAVDGFQRKGGHHTIVFATAPGSTRAPITKPCIDQDMADYQFRLVGVGGAEGDGTGVSKGYHFPSGVSQTIPKGSQIVVQSHYVNPNDTEMMAEDYLNIVYAEPSTVKIKADAFAITSLGFDILPGQTTSVAVPCEVSEDTNVFYILGHTHAWGVRFTLDVTDPATGKTTSLYDQPGGINLQLHPPTVEFPPDRPLALKKGQKLTVHCTWNNTTDHDLKFPEEMCAALMFYYPARGFLTCTEADSFSH